MAKSVLIISSSPRRNGNCDILSKRFYQGATDAFHQAEFINLNDYHIEFCKACEYCRNHQHQCIQKDDADIVIKKMINADVWVFASPIYFYSLSGQLKTLFDRMFAREYEIRESSLRKKAYFILTSGSTQQDDMTGAIESYRGFLKVLRNVDDAGIIYGLGAFEKGAATHHPSYQQAYEIGKSI